MIATLHAAELASDPDLVIGLPGEGSDGRSIGKEGPEGCVQFAVREESGKAAVGLVAEGGETASDQDPTIGLDGEGEHRRVQGWLGKIPTRAIMKFIVIMLVLSIQNMENIA